MDMNMQAEVEVRIEFLKTEFGIEVDEQMMPIIYDYEQTAEKFLLYYYPEADERSSIDLAVILKRLELKCVISEKEKGLAVLDFASKTIFVNKCYNSENFYGSRRIAILHECVHWWLHRQLYISQIISNPGTNQCICTGNSDYSETDIIKRQVDKIARMIAMPRNIFRNYAYNDFNTLIFKEDNDANKMEDAIVLLADIFHVTVFAVKQRMIELGFYQAIGAWCFVDEKHIRPYKYSKRYNFFNKTVDISERSLEKAWNKNKWLKQFLECGYIKYIDGHCVYNDEKYLKNNNLTDYAKMHIEKACIVFDVIKFSECFIGKRSEVCSFDNNILKIKYDVSSSRFDEDDYECRKCFNDNFYSTIRALKKFRKLTYEDLEKESGLSDKQIKNVFYKKSRGINNGNIATKEFILKMCVAFSLNEELSIKLFDLAGYTLRPMDNKIDNGCSMVIKVAKYFDIYRCNEIFKNFAGKDLVVSKN